MLHRASTALLADTLRQFTWLGLACWASVAAATESAVIPPEIPAFLDSHCVRCHGEKKQKGSIRLDDLPGEIGDAAVAQRWQDVLDVLNLSEMPPEEEDQPPSAEVEDFLESLTASLGEARQRLTDSGGEVVVRRLNRREYRKTIESLFGLPVDVSTLPDDERLDGFDHLGQTQGFSSLHLERYLGLGRDVIDRSIALENRPPKPVKQKADPGGGDFKKLREKFGKLDKNIEVFREKSKGSGEPQLRLDISLREKELLTEYLALPAVRTGEVTPFHGINPGLEFRIDRNAGAGLYRVRVRCGVHGDKPAENLFLQVVRGEYNAQVPEEVGHFHVRATEAAPEVIEFTVELDGIRSNRMSFERRDGKRGPSPGMEESRNYYFQFPELKTLWDDEMPDLWIDWVEVDGPLPAPAAPLAMGKLLGDLKLKDLRDEQVPELLRKFCHSAFRHQEPESEYLDRLLGVYRLSRGHGSSAADAFAETLSVVLASPSFLYLYEPRPENTPPRELTPRELAVRLSYFITSAPPDAELFADADSGRLIQTDVFKGHIDRLLDSEAADAFIETFLSGWLELDRLDGIQPEATHAASYDDAVHRASREEVFALFRSVLRENAPVHDLIAADYAVVDRVMAGFYGIDGVEGPGFRKVPLPAGSVRGGWLGQSALLALTGTGERTSPVERGVFVLRKFLDRPPPPAPANVPMLEEDSIGERSIRETLAAHMDKAQCSSCHRRIDPLGFGMENFDPVGLWRETVPSADGTKDFPIKPAGLMPDGKGRFEDFAGLRAHILADRDAFLRGLTENLTTYALGRSIGFTDQETIDRLVAETAADGYRLRSLVHRIVLSEAFLTK